MSAPHAWWADEVSLRARSAQDAAYDDKVFSTLVAVLEGDKVGAAIVGGPPAILLTRRARGGAAASPAEYQVALLSDSARRPRHGGHRAAASCAARGRGGGQLRAELRRERLGQAAECVAPRCAAARRRRGGGGCGGALPHQRPRHRRRLRAGASRCAARAARQPRRPRRCCGARRASRTPASRSGPMRSTDLVEGLQGTVFVKLHQRPSATVVLDVVVEGVTALSIGPLAPLVVTGPSPRCTARRCYTRCARARSRHTQRCNHVRLSSCWATSDGPHW